MSKDSPAVPVKTLGSLSEAKVAQKGPSGDEFTYIDIGSVDNATKRIVAPRAFMTAEAPSRAKQNIRQGDVLVSMTRPNLNAVAKVPPELDGAVASTGFHILRPKNVTPDWLYYAVQSHDFVESMCRVVQGALYPAIRPKDIQAFEITAPEIHVQKQIVEELEKQLSRLHGGVAQLKRVQANLKRYRASVLKAACEGKLVPIEAELARQEGRDYETGAQLLERILEERRKNWSGRGKYKEPAGLETSNLPPLPEGWTWASVDQLPGSEPNAITDGPFGSNLKTEHYTDAGPRVIRLQNIGDGVFVNVLAHISDEHFLKLKKHRIFGGDIVIAAMGEAPPRACIIPGIVGPAIVKADCIRLKPHQDLVPKYIEGALNSDPVRHRTKEIVHGVGRPRLNLSEIKSVVLPIPPMREQVRIAEEIERQFSIISNLDSAVLEALARSSRLRQSLLQQAFSGNLVVTNDVCPSARAVLSAEIVHRLHAEPTFGRVKHQKIFHLCEHIAQLPEIQGQYRREAAGPLDLPLIKENIRQMEELQWYRETSELNEDGAVRKHSYSPLAKAGEHRKLLQQYWPDKVEIITNLIEEMRTWKTEQCEIISTTYAAWNDLLLTGQAPTEAAILHEILNNWHDSKRRIPDLHWLEGISWLAKRASAPLGFGRSTLVLHE